MNHLGVALCFLATAVTFAADPKPNVILILADDFGYECVTANGGRSYQTPNLDRLCATGVRFTRCHVQPLCTPTRVMLMTGLSNIRNYTHFGALEKTQTTFGHIMKQAGYATGIAGKWQLGLDASLPAHFGFDEHCLWQLTRRPSRYKNPGLEINGVEKDFTKGEYGPDIVSEYALDFVVRWKAGPFFLYYPMMLTHDPFEPTPDSPDYSDGGVRGRKAAKGDAGLAARHFADMVAYMDKLVGKLIARVDELGLRDNTLILFLGDNGTGGRRVTKFNGTEVIGGKGLTKDSGTHVPGIANWPGHVVSGKVCDDLIDASDFLPTFCDMAGISIPAGLQLDGLSFAPQLRGESGTPREWLYSWYQPGLGKSDKKSEFAHDKNFKLYADGRLFELVKDPDEESPLADGALPPAVRAAKARLQSVLDSFKGARPESIAKQEREAQ